MSDVFDGPFPGPILYFYEDPEEKRQRIEGAQPPPESVRVPRLAGSGEAEPDAVNYPLLEFPWEPLSQGTQKQSLARQYAQWLNGIGAARLAEFRALLEHAGAPMPAVGQEPADLSALGSWFQDWFRLVAIPATWARSFAPEPGPAAQGANGPNLGPLTWLVHRATHQDDDVFAELADSDEIVRMEAVMVIGSDELHDDRAIPALLNRLEFDPSPHVRERAALGLGRVCEQPEVQEAFLGAAAEDEDVQVRWAARYGLRLAANIAAGGQAG